MKKAQASPKLQAMSPCWTRTFDSLSSLIGRVRFRTKRSQVNIALELKMRMVLLFLLFLSATVTWSIGRPALISAGQLYLKYMEVWQKPGLKLHMQVYLSGNSPFSFLNGDICVNPILLSSGWRCCGLLFRVQERPNIKWTRRSGNFLSQSHMGGIIKMECECTALLKEKETKSRF